MNLLRCRFRTIVLLVVAANAAYVVFVTMGVAGAETRRVAGNLMLVGVPLAAGVAAGLSGVASRGRRRCGWLLLGGAATSWGLGQAVWSFYELVLGRDVPFPSLADVGYLGTVPLAAFGLLSFLDTPARGSARLRAGVEALIIAAAVLIVSWIVVLGPLYRASSGSTLTQVIGLAYPIGDVVLASLLFFVTVHSQRRTRGALATVGMGLAGLVVADTGFALLTLEGGYSTGSPIDLGWLAGFALLGLAALRPLPRASERVRGEGFLSKLTLLFVLGPVIAAVVAGLVAWPHAADDAVLRLGMGVLAGLFIVYQAVTFVENRRLTTYLEQKVAERTAELSLRERYFRSLVQNSSDVVTVLDADLRIAYQTPSVHTVFGYPATDPPGSLVEDLVIPPDRRLVRAALDHAQSGPGTNVVVEAGIRHHTGTTRTVELTITNLIADPAVKGIVVNTRDITERKSLEDQLTYQAFHDPLTGLPNRALLRDRLDHGLARAVRGGGHPLALLFVDLDGFKGVNDGLGHSAGDALLVAFAGRIGAVLRPEDTFARLGGDEFAILVEDPASGVQADVIADRMLRQLIDPFCVDGRTIFVNASIGIATSATARTAEELLRDADVAMYMAKARGKGRFEVFVPDMHASALARLELEADLRRAVDADEFVVEYQPLFSLETGDVTGVEALVRWLHPRRGMVPPCEFIPMAEESGLILQIGDFVLTKACRQARRWVDEFGDDAPTVSVNLSGRQLGHPGLVDRLASVLFETGLEPQRLVLELTESLLVENVEEVVSRLRDLRELGLRLAIDDFGTGYSALSYLQQFPVDILKIDRSFVAAMATGDEHLMRTIIQLGRTLGLSTVAEGIETAEQLAQLRELGCSVGQGFLFSRPVSAEVLTGVLSHRLVAGVGPEFHRM